MQSNIKYNILINNYLKIKLVIKTFILETNIFNNKSNIFQ